METFILAFVLILLSVLGLAIGIIFGRTPLRGSCGGIACLKAIACGGCRKDGSHG